MELRLDLVREFLFENPKDNPYPGLEAPGIQTDLQVPDVVVRSADN